MNLPAPTEHHRRLFCFAGEWDGEETLRDHSSPAAESRLLGRSTARVALEGLAVVADYEQVRDGCVVFRGHGLFTYDSEGAEYLLHWFDGAGGVLRTFSGDFLGDVLTVSHAGPVLQVRLSCDFGEPGHIRSRLEVSEDGRQWRAFSEGLYSRKH